MVSMIHKKEQKKLHCSQRASLRQFLKLHTENASAEMTTWTQALPLIQQIRQQKTLFSVNSTEHTSRNIDKNPVFIQPSQALVSGFLA